ncbi:MAG: hypothetical protein ACK55Z_03615, partial [bacterium]
CISCYYHVAVHPDTPLHLRAQTVHEALLKVINDFLPDVGAVLDSSPLKLVVKCGLIDLCRKEARHISDRVTAFVLRGCHRSY